MSSSPLISKPSFLSYANHQKNYCIFLSDIAQSLDIDSLRSMRKILDEMGKNIGDIIIEAQILYDKKESEERRALIQARTLYLDSTSKQLLQYEQEISTVISKSRDWQWVFPVMAVAGVFISICSQLRALK